MINKNESYSPSDIHSKNYSMELSILVYTSDSEDVITQFQLAMELANNAHLIYSGTVSTIVVEMSEFLSDDEANEIILEVLHHSRTIKSPKIGVKFSIRDCFGDTFEEKIEPLLHSSDLSQIIFYAEYSLKFLSWMEDHVISRETFGFQKCKKNIEQVNRQIEIVVQTRWPDTNAEGSKNIFALVNFWDKMNQWSLHTNNTVLFQSAFGSIDTDLDIRIRRNSEAKNFGWWALVQNHTHLSNPPINFVEEKHMALEASNNTDYTTNRTTSYSETWNLLLYLTLSEIVVIISVISFIYFWRRSHSRQELTQILMSLGLACGKLMSVWRNRIVIRT